MRKFLAALCSVLALYAFAPTAVVFSLTDESQARQSRGGGKSHVSKKSRSSSQRSGGHSSGRSSSRPSSRQNRDHRASRDVNHGRNASSQRNRNSDRNVDRNRDVNRNVNRDVNVDRDVDIDRDWDADGFWAGAAVAGATAAVVGSIAYSVPRRATPWCIGGLTYRDCDGVWYAPQYSGTDVVYVVVDDPR